jgi:hypothetical protein
MEDLNNELISEPWLVSVGFRWHQLERQPNKHWVLWLGVSGRQFLRLYEDLGVELSADSTSAWTCWLRSDFAHRYHRFIYLRDLRAQRELILLVESLSGLNWVPENNLHGAMRTPEKASRIRAGDKRFDRILLLRKERHYDIENDDTRCGALPEHKEIVEGNSW